MAKTPVSFNGVPLAIGGSPMATAGDPCDCCGEPVECCGPQGGCCYSHDSWIVLTRIGLVAAAGLAEPYKEAVAQYMAMANPLTLTFDACEADQPVWAAHSESWTDTDDYRVRVEVRKTAAGWNHYIYVARSTDSGVTWDNDWGILAGGTFSFVDPHPLQGPDDYGDCCGYSFTQQGEASGNGIPTVEEGDNEPEGVYSINSTYNTTYGDSTLDWEDADEDFELVVYNNNCCESGGECQGGGGDCAGDCNAACACTNNNVPKVLCVDLTGATLAATCTPDCIPLPGGFIQFDIAPAEPFGQCWYLYIGGEAQAQGVIFWDNVDCRWKYIWCYDTDNYAVWLGGNDPTDPTGTYAPVAHNPTDPNDTDCDDASSPTGNIVVRACVVDPLTGLRVNASAAMADLATSYTVTTSTLTFGTSCMTVGFNGPGGPYTVTPADLEGYPAAFADDLDSGAGSIQLVWDETTGYWWLVFASDGVVVMRGPNIADDPTGTYSVVVTNGCFIAGTVTGYATVS